MSKSLLDAFYFDKNERKGILLFLFLIWLLFMMQMFIPYLLNPYEDLVKTINQFEEINNQPERSKMQALETFKEEKSGFNQVTDSTKFTKKKHVKTTTLTNQIYFNFDPNHISKDSLKILGFHDHVIRNWLKYREAGGKFLYPEDVLKIYGMDSSCYASIKPYVRFKKEKVNSLKPLVNKQINLNQAQAEELQSLYGIGPVLSQRIIKFRDALGGFHNIDQIKEVYGLADSVFTSIQPKLIITKNPAKININQANEEQLSKHPYISWKQAKLIARFRLQRTSISDINQLFEIKAFDSAYVYKILPYCEI